MGAGMLLRIKAHTQMERCVSLGSSLLYCPVVEARFIQVDHGGVAQAPEYVFHYSSTKCNIIYLINKRV